MALSGFCPLLLLLLTMSIYCCYALLASKQPLSRAITPPPFLSPRFLHFSLQVSPQWWLDPLTRLLAIFESTVDNNKNNNSESNGSRQQQEGWQLILLLSTSQPGQMVPLSTLANVSVGGQPKAVLVEGMPECAAANKASGGMETVHLEVELAVQAIFVRAKNSVKYPLPRPLLGPSDLRVFFVRQVGGQGGQQQTSCQLSSDMDIRATSRFALPPTTARPPSPPLPSPPVVQLPPPASVAPLSGQLSPADDQQKQSQPAYKRKKMKIPRRSTMAAQRLLSPAHYVPKEAHRRQGAFVPQQRLLYRPRTTGARGGSDGRQAAAPQQQGAEEEQSTTAVSNYIDIINDRHLYQEVQRSRTNEINSRWSWTFLAFSVFVTALISLSGAFALAMFVLLQCRPSHGHPKSCAD